MQQNFFFPLKDVFGPEAAQRPSLLIKGKTLNQFETTTVNSSRCLASSLVDDTALGAVIFLSTSLVV